MTLLHASTFVLRSSSQIPHLLNAVKEIAHGNTLLYALSHDAPDLESSIRQLGSSAKESIGCLSSPLPLYHRQPFFSCSVAVFDPGYAVTFGCLEAGPPPVRIGRSHSYGIRASRVSEERDEEKRTFTSDERWNGLWGPEESEIVIPQDLEGAK